MSSLAQVIRTRRILGAIACAAALLLFLSNADAQPGAGAPTPSPGYATPPPQPFAQPPPPPGIYRHGWIMGFGFGFGSITANDTFESGEELDGVFGNLHFGGMVSPRLALMVEVWGGTHRFRDDGDYYYGDDTSLLQSNIGLAAQYWVTPKLWLKAGLGEASLILASNGEKLGEAKGAAFLGAAGYEFYQRGRMAIDVSLRLTTATYEEGDGETQAVALQVGFNWY